MIRTILAEDALRLGPAAVQLATHSCTAGRMKQTSTNDNISLRVTRAIQTRVVVCPWRRTVNSFKEVGRDDFPDDFEALLSDEEALAILARDSFP